MPGSIRAWIRRLLLSVAALGLASCVLAQEAWTVGTVAGASFRLKTPDAWNGFLVLAAGGYSPGPVTFRPDQTAGRFAEEVVRQGYAYAETGYSVGGVGIAEGVADVRALREHFVRAYGAPKRTFVVGESKGGLVALLLMESGATGFDGALTISGLLAGPQEFFRQVFDTLLVYQRHFPSILPDPERIPWTYVANEQIVAAVLASLERNDQHAAEVRRLTAARNNRELAEFLAFHTEALGDLQRRCTGNGFGDAAEAAARRCVARMPTPGGRLQRPLIAVDARHDPIIPAVFAEKYAERVGTAGRQGFFVRSVVDGDGHLAVRTADRLSAFAALVRWVAEGVRPGAARAPR